jgi:hypothetical protein
MQPEPRTLESQSGSKQSLDLGKMPSDAWRPSESPGQRRSPRTSEREIERIPAWIRSATSPDWVRVRLWDFSIHGFGILYHSNSGHFSFSHPGENVELRLGGTVGAASAAEKGTLVSCRIENSARLEKGMRIGLSRLDLSGSGDPGAMEFPEGYLCDGIRPLSAKIRNPFLYNEWAEAQLIAIGPGAAFVFESSDPSLLLFAGTRVKLDLEVPHDSNGEFSGTLAWIEGHDGRLVFAISGGDMPYALSNAVGEHFVQAEICKPSRLADFGIRMKRFKDQFLFKFVSTQEEYRHILALRRTAYVNAGKAPPDATLESVEDEIDANSRLLTAFHGDFLIASIAMTFGSEGAHFRSETCFPGSTYPVKLPPKKSMVEVRSLCTDFDYRGGDLIQGMFEHIARSVLFSEKEWLITFATPELWPLYRRIGFRKTGASVAIAHLAGKEHHLILMHRNSLISGRRMTPFAWNYFFGQMVRDLMLRGVLRLGALQKARVACYSMFAGLTRKWMRSQLEREFRVLLQKNIRQGSFK